MANFIQSSNTYQLQQSAIYGGTIAASQHYYSTPGTRPDDPVPMAEFQGMVHELKGTLQEVKYLEQIIVDLEGRLDDMLVTPKRKKPVQVARNAKRRKHGRKHG